MALKAHELVRRKPPPGSQPSRFGRLTVLFAPVGAQVNVRALCAPTKKETKRLGEITASRTEAALVQVRALTSHASSHSRTACMACFLVQPDALPLFTGHWAYLSALQAGHAP